MFQIGAVFAWGRNTFGQLGLDDMQNRNMPCQLRFLRDSRVCYAACGEEFSVFLTMVNFTCSNYMRVEGFNKEDSPLVIGIVTGWRGVHLWCRNVWAIRSWG